MNNLLVVSLTGKDHPDLVQQMAQAVFKCGCHTVESRLTVIAGRAMLMMSIRGEWNNLARLENALSRLGKSLDAVITANRVEKVPRRPDLVPFVVEVVGMDRPGILDQLTRFFLERQIAVLDMSTHCYEAAQTGATLCSVNLTLGIPGDTSLAGLRDEFFEQCDHLNVDAILEPVKN